MLRTSLALALAGVAVAQTPIPLPPFVSTFTSSLTRGFWFTCPINCTIVGLEVPNESAQPNQVVEVIDFGAVPPPVFPATAVGAQMFYNNTAAAGTRIDTRIVLVAGNCYGILGACNPAPASATSANSYGPAGAFASNILGNAIVLTRFGTQSGIASNGGNQPCWQEPAAAVSRVGVWVARTGTVNVGGVNDYYVTPPGGGLPAVNAPCPSPTVTLSAAATPHIFRVTAPASAAGGIVVSVLSFLAPCNPGAVCLPPVAGPYAGIPGVQACGGGTNQSLDLVAPVATYVLFSGVMNAAGDFAQSVTIYPGFAGFSGSTQAYFLDLANGFVLTEAWNFAITL